MPGASSATSSAAGAATRTTACAPEQLGARDDVGADGLVLGVGEPGRDARSLLDREREARSDEAPD